MIRQYAVAMTNKSSFEVSKVLNDAEIKYLLEKRAAELNIKVAKCANCKNPCGPCKINYLKKEYKKHETKAPSISSV